LRSGALDGYLGASPPAPVPPSEPTSERRDDDPSIPDDRPAPEASADEATPDDASAVDDAADDAPATDDAAPTFAIDDDPSLRQHLRGRWGALPTGRRRLILALVGLGIVAWAIVTWWPERVVGPAPLSEREANARAEWAAILRQSPEPLGLRVAAGTLGPGDAQMPDDRYEDYYSHVHPDSTRFSVVVVSTDFAPDVAVRTPGGETVAASALLRTARRAEAAGLVGPGRFEITVTSRESDGEGSYEVLVVPETPVDSLYAGDEPRVDTLGGGVRLGGRFERPYGLVAQGGVPVVVRVVSAAFVPRVELLGPGGALDGASALVERRSQGDSLHGVLLRYLPGWDAPYRLIVSSETPGASGPYAIEVAPVQTRELRADGRGLTSTLGDASWLVGPRYVDYYRFTTRAGMRTTVTASSTELPPALRLWRAEGRGGGQRAIGEAPNDGGAFSAQIAVPPEPGEYLLEVTTGGRDTTAAIGGPYSVVVRSEPVAPPPPRTPREPSRPAPRSDTGATSRTFGVSASATGQSGGSSFQVSVTQVALSYPAGRTRIQLSVSVRSVDYTGNWAPWASFVSKGYVLDDQGRRYSAAAGESASPSGPAAEPGTVRRGTAVFYAAGTVTGQSRFRYVASLGEASVTLSIPVPA